MNKILLLTLAALVLVTSTASAQVPAVVHASWQPNPTADNVVSYVIGLDITPSVVLPAASCTPTACVQALTVALFGAHTVTVAAQNLKFAADPTSLQSGPPLSVSFTLAAAPVVVTGLKVGP